MSKWSRRRSAAFGLAAASATLTMTVAGTLVPAVAAPSRHSAASMPAKRSTAVKPAKPVTPCSTGATQGPISTSIAGAGTQYEVAYRGEGSANGCLMTATEDGSVTIRHLGLAADTAPAITIPGDGQYETAFQANTGFLWTSGFDGNRNRRYGMAANTSPAITADDFNTSSYQIAFQANTGRLWMTGSAGTRAFPWGMAPGTSPAIAEFKGGFRIAFQANTGHLWVTDVIARNSAAAVHAHDLGLGMMAGTSPSIIDSSNAGTQYQVAFQANTGIMWSVGAQGRFAHNYGMAAGTSPRICGNASSYVVTFQTNVHSIYVVGPARPNQILPGPSRTGSSPSLTVVRTPGQTYGFEVAYARGNGSSGVVRATGARDWDYPID